MAKKDAPVAAKESKAPMASRSLTETEIAEMHGDDLPPDGYSNSKLLDPPAEGAPPAEAAAVAEPPAEAAPGATPPPATEPPAAPAPPVAGDDTFIKLERELAKPEGKEDLSSFSAREKAYFHQMRRDRKARQKAEEERDGAVFKLNKALNPPPPPPDPLEGMSDDDVLLVKDVREKLAKAPKPVPQQDQQANEPTAQAKRYLIMCEKEARAAHPEDFDAVMDLSDDLLTGDATALVDLSEATKRGENPAEAMYERIKKHKDFETLLPAAQVRVQARKQPAATPASPSAPATPTPEDKAKLDAAKAAEKALESNKTKTTAHVSAREGKPAEELTLEEISNMSDLTFAKLPRHVRQRYLKQFGG